MEQFKDFLKRKNVYGQFIINLNNKDCNGVIATGEFVTFSDFINKREKDRYVCSAFIWSKSTEGSDYWDVIDEEWGDKL